MFNQTDQDNPDTPTTLSLREDPEPALQKAREQASRELYSGLIGGAIDLAHATHANLGGDFIGPDAGTGRQRHDGSKPL